MRPLARCGFALCSKQAEVVSKTTKWRMNIRGWVYVFSNVAMHGRVKVGFSTKDPLFRIRELDGTGLPHPFVREYDVLVEEPRDVEQATHKRLAEYRDAKEFFLVNPGTAIAAIRQSIQDLGKVIIAEQTNPSSDLGTYDFSRAAPVSLAKRCPVCRATLSHMDTHRCSKCFSLLP